MNTERLKAWAENMRGVVWGDNDSVSADILALIGERERLQSALNLSRLANVECLKAYCAQVERLRCEAIQREAELQLPANQYRLEIRRLETELDRLRAVEETRERHTAEISSRLKIYVDNNNNNT